MNTEQTSKSIFTYNPLLRFFTLFIDSYFNILVFPENAKYCWGTVVCFCCFIQFLCRSYYKKNKHQMSFLWGRFEVGEGGLPSPLSSPKLVRMMLKTSNLVYTYTHMCSFRKYTCQYQRLINFAYVSIFLQKINTLGENSTFTQSNTVRAVLEIFSSFSSLFSFL